MSGLRFTDGAFRVSVCRHGHVTLEVLDDGEAVKFVAVMSKDEAFDLAACLVGATDAVRRRGPARSTH